MVDKYRKEQREKQVERVREARMNQAQEMRESQRMREFQIETDKQSSLPTYLPRQVKPPAVNENK